MGRVRHQGADSCKTFLLRLALTLIVAQVVADHHDATVPANHLALVADLLDARLYLHCPSCSSDVLLVSVDDPPATKVVGAQFNDYPVVRKDSDVVHPHPSADVGQDLMAVIELHPEHSVRERLDHSALDLDGAVFFGQNSSRFTDRSSEAPVH